MAAFLTPLGNKVLIKPIPEASTFAGGALVLPESAKQESLTGIVLSVGEGEPNADGFVFESQVKEGDKVLFMRYAGAKIEFGGETYLVISEKDLLGVFNPDVK